MGKTNIAVNNWLSDKGRFADLFNGTVFGGRQVVMPEELENLDRETDVIITGKNEKTKGIQRYRDIIKRWRGNADLAVLACESQDKVNYAMPVRNMLYDSLTYTEQMCEIWRNRRKNEKNNAGANERITVEEYLSRFRKSDRIVPVITLVFYYDLKPWDGALDLHGMFGIDTRAEEGQIIKKYVPNYRINLLDAGNIPDTGKFQSDLQQILGVLKYREDKDELQRYIQSNSDYFRSVDAETYQALREFLHSEKMLKEISDSEAEAGIDMCQALEELYEDGVKTGREEGREKGREEGISMVIVNMLKSGMAAGDIKRCTGVSDSIIAQAEKSME